MKVVFFVFGFILGLVGINLLAVGMVDSSLLPCAFLASNYFLVSMISLVVGSILCVSLSFYFNIHHTVTDLLKFFLIAFFIVAVILLPSVLKTIFATCVLFSLGYIIFILILLILRSYGWRGSS